MSDITHTTKPTEYMTPAAFCEMVGIRPQTAAKWRCTGAGPAFTRVGHAVRYSRAVVEAWLASRTASSTTEADALEAVTA
jgi:predicted site-specific integrase-resolvase